MISLTNKPNAMLIFKLMGILLLGVLLLAGCAKPKPADDTNKQKLEFDGLMGTRYTEFLIVWGSQLKKEFIAGDKNTDGLNQTARTNDS